MKLYLSADIEGTAGTMHWDEGNAAKAEYGYFQQQMTKEVAAACEGALAAGADEILVKDAHYTARNIIPSMLPEQTRIFRGWDNTPEMMLAGIDQSFDGVLFTGYHAAAGTGMSPLAHTMNPKALWVKCNGKLISEFYINALTAAYYGVPVFFLSGDRGVCEAVREANPEILTVATNEGRAGGAVCIHPDLAVKQIRETVARALAKPKAACMVPLPPYFEIEICYKEHMEAAKAVNYPNVTRIDAQTVALAAADWMEIVQAFFWIL